MRNAFETGRGRIVMRGKAEVAVTKTGREQIIINEVPYQVSPSQIIVKAVDLVNEKIVDGISEIRDESDRNGLRIVFDLKRDCNSEHRFKSIIQIHTATNFIFSEQHRTGQRATRNAQSETDDCALR